MVLVVILFVLFFSSTTVQCVSKSSLVYGVTADGVLVQAGPAHISNDAIDNFSWNIVGTVNGQRIKKVAVGKELDVWVITEQGNVFVRVGITPKNLVGVGWSNMGDIKLKAIAAGAKGVWGITTKGIVVKRIGFCKESPYGEGWINTGGVNGQQITVGPNGGAIYTTVKGHEFLRQNHSWVSSQHYNASVYPDRNWLLSKSGGVSFSRGLSVFVVGKRSWESVASHHQIQKISVAPDLQVWALDFKGQPMVRMGITPTYQKGFAWQMLPGLLIDIAGATIPHIVTGDEAYTHLTSQGALYSQAAFDGVWQLRSSGQGKVSFQVRANANAQVYFSQEQNRLDKDTYVVDISQHALSLQKIGDDDVQSTVQFKDHLLSSASGADWKEYWVELDDGFIRCGSKDKELVVLADAQPYDVKFVGFGGKANDIQEFRAITFDNYHLHDKQKRIQKDFEKLQGIGRRVAAGMKDSQQQFFMIGKDNMIYRYDDHKRRKFKWVQLAPVGSKGQKIEGFKDVAASSDGVVVGAGLDGKAYCFSWKQYCWQELDKDNTISFDRLAVGNRLCLWGLDKSTRNVYQWKRQGWRLQGVGGMSLSTALDGTVIAVDVAGDVYQFNYFDDEWDQLPNPGKVGRVAVQSQHEMLGTRQVGDLFYLWKFKKEKNIPGKSILSQLSSQAKAWHPERVDKQTFAVGFKQIDVDSQGNKIALDQRGSIYKSAMQKAKINDVSVKSVVQNYAKLLREATLQIQSY